MRMFGWSQAIEGFISFRATALRPCPFRKQERAVFSSRTSGQNPVAFVFFSAKFQ
jgi:hypothetical protein